MNRKFEEILQNCIAEIKNGQTLEGCLLAYPEFADRLAPLLKTASLLSSALPEVSPSLDFEEETGAKLLAAVRAKRTELPKKISLPFQKRWAIIPVVPAGRQAFAKVAAAALVCFMLTGGVVAASANSLPNSPLYVVKKGVEKIQLALTFDEEAKVELHLKLAQKRLDEAEALKEKNQDGEAFEICVKDINKNLEQARSLAEGLSAENKEELLAKVTEFAGRESQISKDTTTKVATETSDETKEEIALADSSAEPTEESMEEVTEGQLAQEESAVEEQQEGTSQESEKATKPQEGDYAHTSLAPFEIVSLSVDLSIFSPNGDGVKDSVVISVKAKSGQTFEADLFRGDIHFYSNLFFNENSSGSGNYSVVWDGRDNNGYLLENGIYTIKVKDRFGRYAGKEVKVTIDTVAPAFIPISPSNGKIVSNDRPTFRWQPVVDAGTYTFQCSQGADFGGVTTITASGLNVDYFTIPDGLNLDEGMWYWRVLCTDKAGNTSSSVTMTFIVN